MHRKYRITVSGRDDNASVELLLTDAQADAYRYLSEEIETTDDAWKGVAWLDVEEAA